MTTSNLIHQSTRGFTEIIFIHSSLDDSDLTASQFRVFAHLSRRASSGQAWPSAESIAECCRINRDTVWSALKELESRKFISRHGRPGKTTVWEINEPRLWVLNREEPPSGKEGPGTQRKRRGDYPAEKRGHEGNPLKVPQLKGTEAVVGSTSQTSPPPPPKPAAAPDRMALEQRMGMEAAEVRKRYADPKWKELGVNPKLVFHKLCKHCDPLGEPVTLERYDIWLKREWRTILARPAKKGNGGWSRS